MWYISAPMGKTKQAVSAPAEDELPKLNARETKFVAHYSVHFNGAAAVRFAGYQSIRPNEYARELLTKPHIQKHVDLVRKDLGTLHFDLANQATAKLAAMMSADRTQIYDADGNMLDPKDWPEECKLLLAGIEIEEVMVGEGDAAHMVRTKKVKLEAPKGIIDSVHKVMGAIVDRTQLLDAKGKPINPSSILPVINVTVVGQEKKK